MTSTLPAPTTPPKRIEKQRTHKTGGLPLLLILPALVGLALPGDRGTAGLAAGSQ